MTTIIGYILNSKPLCPNCYQGKAHPETPPQGLAVALTQADRLPIGGMVCADCKAVIWPPATVVNIDVSDDNPLSPLYPLSGRADNLGGSIEIKFDHVETSPRFYSKEQGDALIASLDRIIINSDITAEMILKNCQDYIRNTQECAALMRNVLKGVL